MNSKKWFYTTLSISFLSYLIVLIVYIVIDPEIVFNNSLTDKKFGYTKYHSKYQFDKLKSKQYTLIFGTSRSQKLSSSALKRDILNFHDIYGEPDDILNFLSQLNEKQLNNIKHIYYLISIHTMTDEISKLNYKSNSFIDKLAYILPLSSLSMKRTLKDLKFNFLKNSIYYYIDDDGSLYVNDQNQSVVLNKKNISKPAINTIKKNNSIKKLLQVNNFCKKNNLPITYYTPTYSDKFLIDVETVNYLWTKLLDGGINEFYTLYYIDGISDNKSNNQYYNFTNESHLNYTTMNKVFQDIVLDKDNTRLISNKDELSIRMNTLRLKVKNYASNHHF